MFIRKENDAEWKEKALFFPFFPSAVERDRIDVEWLDISIHFFFFSPFFLPRQLSYVHLQRFIASRKKIKREYIRENVKERIIKPLIIQLALEDDDDHERSIIFQYKRRRTPTFHQTKRPWYWPVLLRKSSVNQQSSSLFRTQTKRTCFIENSRTCQYIESTFTKSTCFFCSSISSLASQT